MRRSRALKGTRIGAGVQTNTSCFLFNCNNMAPGPLLSTRSLLAAASSRPAGTAAALKPAAVRASHGIDPRRRRRRHRVRSAAAVAGLPPFQSDADKPPSNDTNTAATSLFNGAVQPPQPQPLAVGNDAPLTAAAPSPISRPHPRPLPPSVVDDQAREEMDALLSDGWYSYPVATSATPPTTTEEAAAAAAAALTDSSPAGEAGGISGGAVGGGGADGSARVLDLFARAASPIGTAERAQAALAAARAAQSPGIINVQPGPAIDKKEPPKKDAKTSMMEIEATSAGAINFAKPTAVRAAEARAAADSGARIKAINASYSEESTARAAIAASVTNRFVRGDSPSPFYGGSGGGGGVGGGASTSSSSPPSSRADMKPKSGPASDFWSWSPPQVAADDYHGGGGAGGGGAPTYVSPQLQRKQAPARVEQAVMLLERAPEKKLPAFQSVVEAQGATLPSFQSDVESADGSMPSFKTEAGGWRFVETRSTHPGLRALPGCDPHPGLIKPSMFRFQVPSTFCFFSEQTHC